MASLEIGAKLLHRLALRGAGPGMEEADAPKATFLGFMYGGVK